MCGDSGMRTQKHSPQSICERSLWLKGIGRAWEEGAERSESRQQHWPRVETMGSPPRLWQWRRKRMNAKHIFYTFFYCGKKQPQNLFLTIIHTGCSILHSHQQCTRVPISPHLTDAQYFLGFDSGHTDGCEVVTPVVLISTSLIRSDVEHLLTCFLAICVSSLKKYLFKSFDHFWIGLFLLLLWGWSSLYILNINPLSNA